MAVISLSGIRANTDPELSDMYWQVLLVSRTAITSGFSSGLGRKSKIGEPAEIDFKGCRDAYDIAIDTCE